MALFGFINKWLPSSNDADAGAHISHHLDLYRYWRGRRGESTTPAKSDFEPGDICALLPFLTILDKVEGQFRYRLHGSAAAKEIGRDLTGGFVGSYVSAPESAAAMRAVCERVFVTGRPVFSTGEFKIKPSFIHNMSVLLPLSDDGVTVNMAVSTLIARFNFDVKASADWLDGVPAKCAMSSISMMLQKSKSAVLSGIGAAVGERLE